MKIMELFSFFFVLIFCSAAALAETHIHKTKLIPEKFLQKVNHSKPNTDYWIQLYYRTNAGIKKGKPVFVLLTNDLDQGSEWFVEGQLQEYAKWHDANLLLFQHRFFSPMSPNENWSTDNLSLMTVDQARRDLIYFIQKKNETYQSKKWFVFGSGYLGSLAAFAEVINPSVVYGAISSSAPMKSMFDFDDYYPMLKKSLDSYTKECSSKLHAAIQELTKLSKSGQGLVQIKNKFNLKFQVTKEEIPILVYQLANRISAIVERNKIYGSNGTVLAKSIPSFCDKMTKSGTSKIDRFARYHNDNFNSSLIHNYNGFVNNLKSSTVFNIRRVELYQACSQNGHFATSSRFWNLYESYLKDSFFEKLCQDVFDKRFTSKFMKKLISTTNDLFKTIKDKAARTVFVSGSLDPWSTIGVVDKMWFHKFNVISIKGGYHSSEMHKFDSYTASNVRQAQLSINSTLTKWIKE